MQKSIDLNLQQKIYTKAYYIIYSLCGSTHVESNKIGFTIFGFFCDLLWFFKDSAEINKNEKDKTPSKTIMGGCLASFGKFGELSSPNLIVERVTYSET